jgi:hypothetical protein
MMSPAAAAVASVLLSVSICGSCICRSSAILIANNKADASAWRTEVTGAEEAEMNNYEQCVFPATLMKTPRPAGDGWWFWFCSQAASKKMTV